MSLPLSQVFVALACAGVGGAVLVPLLRVYRVPAVVDVTERAERGTVPAPASWHEREIRNLGFTYCGDFVEHYGERTGERLIAHLSHDWLHWAILYTRADDRGAVTHVEFATSFDPDATIVTGNRRPVFMKPVSIRILHDCLPGCLNPRRLHALHQVACDGAEAGDLIARAQRPSDFRKWDRDRYETELEELAARGRLRQIDDEAARLSVAGFAMEIPRMVVWVVRHGLLFWLPALGVGRRRRLVRFVWALRLIEAREAGEES